MDKRLQDFVEAIHDISNPRTIDPRNPTVFQMTRPVPLIDASDEENARKFMVIGSIIEPTQLGLVINAVWINLNPESKFYKYPLKLKAITSPSSSSIPGVIKDQGYSLCWIELTKYGQLFDEIQTAPDGTSIPGITGGSGNKGLDYVGDWSNVVTYAKGKSVRYMGSTYVSIQANNLNNNPATGTAFWQIVSLVGVAPIVDRDALVQGVNDFFNS